MVTILFYTIGIPLSFWWILYTNQRKLVLQTPRVLGRFGFLYSKYQDEVWYWELFEMFRKLIFTSVVMFFATGTTTQVVFAMFIAFVFLISHISIRAYKEPLDFRIQTVSMICIFVTLWMGLLNRTGVVLELDVPGVNSWGSNFFKFITRLSQFAPFVATLVAFVASVWKVVNKLVVADCCPDFGCSNLFRLCAGKGDATSRNNDMLSLAMAVNTAEAGDAVASAVTAEQEKVATVKDKRAERRTAKDAVKLEKLKEYADLTKDKHRRASLDGAPDVTREKHRKLFLQQLSVSQHAIVLRHWPIGKA